MKFERVLALSPHTDDVELGAGGTVARLVEQGADVSIIAFSTGNANGSEAKQAAEALGAAWLDVRDWPARRFLDWRQEILESLVEVRESHSPDLVLCPSSFDFHQDHEVIRAEALRAFRTCTILGYELPWSCRQFDAQCLVRLEHSHYAAKEQALSSYESQWTKDYFGIVACLARVRGIQGGFEYAEAFEVIRWTM